MASRKPERDDVDLDADAAVVRGALAADERARQQLGDRLGCVDRMLKVRNRRAGNWLDPHELEDLGQEVRATIWRRLADYKAVAALSAWIYGFCEFHMRNAVRKKQRRPKSAEFDESMGGSEPAKEPPFHDHVHTGIARLEPIDQRIVRLKHFDGLTLEAIAAAVDLKLNTVKSRYFRALNRLRSALAPHYRGES